MKKFLIVVGILLGLVILGLTIFIATFDLDRHRGVVVECLSSALGKPVGIERISLGWSGGLAFQAQGVSVYPELSAKRMSLWVPWKPLIQSVLKGRWEPSELVASFRLKVEEIRLNTFKSPIDSIQVDVDRFVSNHRIEISQLSARIAEGKISAKGVVDHLVGRPEATFSFTVENLDLGSILPDPDPREPHLQGRFFASFQGAASGLTPEEMKRTLTGQGRLRLTEARIVHLNILRAAFQPIAILPGLIEILQSRLPPNYRERLAAEDTVLEPMDLGFKVENGTFSFDDFRVATDSLELVGAGRLGLDGKLSCRVTLRMETALSAAFIRSVEELRALTNAEGQLELPATVEGTLPRVMVLPDLQYVVTRLATNVAEGLIGGLLDDLLKK